MALNPLRSGVSKLASFATNDKYYGVKTNWWKPATFLAGGAAVGVGLLATIRPTYSSGGGPLITQQSDSLGGIGGLMNSIMPMMMMMMMIPMMQGMMKSSNKSKDEGSDN